MEKIQILSAEDCPLTKVVLKQKMDEKGWELIETADGMEAIEKYNECNPDLILLDINMPRRDGVEVMEIIRLTNSQTPILFYSTLAKVEEIKAIIAKYKNNYVSNINHGIEGVIDDIEKLLADSNSMEDAYSKREKEQEKRRAEALKTRYKILRYAIIAMMVLSVVISMFLLLS